MGNRSTSTPAGQSGMGPGIDCVANFIAALDRGGFDPKPQGADKWESRCPAHDGGRRNLSITASQDGCVLIKCHHAPSCTADAIVKALGLEMSHLFPPALGTPARPKVKSPSKSRSKPTPRRHDSSAAALDSIRIGKPSATWTYHDAAGDVSFIVGRFDRPDGKTYRPVHVTPEGWVVGDPPGPLPLYHCPDLAGAERIYLTEGEKCCDLARNLGVVGTTTSHGAKSVKNSDLAPLAGKEVVILPDADEAGELYAKELVKLLAEVDPQPTVKVLRLPDLANEGDDIEQWLESVPDAWEPEQCRAELDRLADVTLVSGTGNGHVNRLPPPLAPFRLDLVNSAAFFGQDYPLEWLVKGITVKGEPSVIGGPSKALKTSILIDKIISLGTATPFLGKFDVPQPRRVALISGESGRRVIQANARQVCLARGLTVQDLGNIHWGFTLPQLTNAKHLAVLRETIEELELEYIALDPFYLTLLAGAAGVDPANMFEMGPVLADVARTCLEAGCTPDLAHHFVKKRDDPFAEPELTDLAYSGIGQFVRQWVLVAHRERFDSEIGLFKLHFTYGGSAGHCGEYALDIEVGKLDPDVDRRCWKVQITSPSEIRNARDEQRKAEAERREAEKAEQDRVKVARRVGEDAEMLRQVMIKLGRPETLNKLREHTCLNGERSRFAMTFLVDTGQAIEAPVIVSNSTGTRSVQGYALTGRSADPD